MIRRMPGSCQANADPETLAAFLVSTSDLYNRPEGEDVKIPSSTSIAGYSGCGPAGMWYSTPTKGTSPTRRSVTIFSPSCGGSSV